MAKYREILAARPDMMSAARHLAFDHWKRGESGAAIAALESAIRAGSPTPGAQVQLATYLSDTGQIREGRCPAGAVDRWTRRLTSMRSTRWLSRTRGAAGRRTRARCSRAVWRSIREA